MSCIIHEQEIKMLERLRSHLNNKKSGGGQGGGSPGEGGKQKQK